MRVTIFSTGGIFCPVLIFTKLHALTLVARSYALLVLLTQLLIMWPLGCASFAERVKGRYSYLSGVSTQAVCVGWNDSKSYKSRETRRIGTSRFENPSEA